MLNPNLSNPLQVLHKLEREMHRAFHHRNYIHKSDLFYNFCITALSLKDYVFDYLNITDKSEKQPYYDEWAKHRLLKAATEIANTSKHSKLKEKPKTNSVVKSTTVIVNMVLQENGEFKEIEEEVPDYSITLSDGQVFELYEFTRGVIDYWKDYLSNLGISYTMQDEHSFFGDDET